jgi:hypothetical protein
MRNKSLLTLALITLVIIIAAAISSGDRAPQTEIDKPPLSAGLKGRVNDVSQIVIESPDNAVHIMNIDNEWVVMQADNYPARFDKVKKLVLDIADLYILSEKTSNPALFQELGVEDHTAENAGSSLLTLLDKTGNTLISIILGNTRSPDGLYVRNAGSNNTYLVAGQPDASADPTDWIEKSLLDIANERVMEVTIEHPGAETLSLRREKGTENFILSAIPGGRKARSQYFTNQPGTFLADLDIENVKSRETFIFPEPPVKTTIKTYDGLVATINSAKIETLNHAAMEFSVDDALIGQNQTTEDTDTIVIGEQQAGAPDVRQEAEQLNNLVFKWVFIIPQSKYLLLSKRIEELTDTIEVQEPE